MRKPTTFLQALALGLAGAILTAATSLAVPITYTLQATATGSRGGVAFTDADVLLTMNNDTSNVIGGPTLFEILGTVTVSVNGAAPLTFTDSMEVFSAITLAPATVGFADLTIGLDVLDDSSVSFQNYDLRTAVGPISGNPAFSSLNQSFPTTGGALILTSVPGNTSTFTATTVAVPAPGGLPVVVAFASVLFAAKLLERSRKRRYL
jgi:hypothetical protein